MRKSKEYDKKVVRFVVIVLLFIFASNLLKADRSITRGSAVGEIYFTGQTLSSPDASIYHSTDFGETAVCVDSISYVESICSDKTLGVLYCNYYNSLYFSNNYGQYGSWIFRTNEGASGMASGRTDGEVFKGAGLCSNDYGISFDENSLNGFVTYFTDFEIGVDDSIGYYIGYLNGNPDSIYLSVSYDNFENLELQHVFNWQQSHRIWLSRGFESGELYLYKSTMYLKEKELYYSNDYGETWELKNEFNCPNLPIKGIVGGRQPGEFFMLVKYIQLTGQISHIYIYHSLDYGETFTVHHPFSHGPEPIYANFEGSPVEGEAPLTVQFTDLSNGNIDVYEWDFDNDGTIDSNEQNPEYTYQDTGYYTVSLTVFPVYDTATRYDYIHVDVNSAIEEKPNNDKVVLQNKPNPFKTNTKIRYEVSPDTHKSCIEIFNIKGQRIETIPVNSEFGSVNWNSKNLSSGIYFYKLDIEDSPVKKMIKLK